MLETGDQSSLPVLRQYRTLAPWNVRDLAWLATAMLETSGVRPTSAAARAGLSQRTIRYYVTRGLVPAPEGRGNAAIYSYRHLLRILMIKMRQMEGATLTSISAELKELTGDVIERRVASVVGPGLASPDVLLTDHPEPTGGRSGQAIHTWNATGPDEAGGDHAGHHVAKWLRIRLGQDLELHVHEGHPLAKHIGEADVIAEAVRGAVDRIIRRGG